MPLRSAKGPSVNAADRAAADAEGASVAPGRSAARDAEQIGIGQRIAEKALHRGAGGAQARADEGRHQYARKAEAPHDGLQAYERRGAPLKAHPESLERVLQGNRKRTARRRDDDGGGEEQPRSGERGRGPRAPRMGRRKSIELRVRVHKEISGCRWCTSTRRPSTTRGPGRAMISDSDSGNL